MSDDAANSEYDKASDEELTAYGLNDLGQLQPDETLDDRGVDDPLDERITVLRLDPWRLSTGSALPGVPKLVWRRQDRRASATR